ncbi:MAG: type II toxin-antitoxin system PemK/MazF family toxin [Methanosarcinales archaeon]
MQEIERNYKKGDIVLTDFPYTDRSTSKVRPAVVIGKSSRFFDYIICAISSVIPSNINRSVIMLTQETSCFSATGLRTNSVILVDKIITIREEDIITKIGELDADTLLELDKKLIQVCEIDEKAFLNTNNPKNA